MSITKRKKGDNMKEVTLKKLYSMKGYKDIEKIIKYLHKVGKKEDSFYIQAQGEKLLVGNQYIALYLPIEDIGNEKICSESLPLMKEFNIYIEANSNRDIDFSEILENKERETEINKAIFNDLDTKDLKLSYLTSLIFHLYNYIPSIERIQKILLPLLEIVISGKVSMSIQKPDKGKNIVLIFEFEDIVSSDNKVTLLMMSYPKLSFFEKWDNED